MAILLLTSCTGAVASVPVRPPPAAEVVSHLSTDQKWIYLTFDLCGGRGGSDLDSRLLGFLETRRIPGSIFMTRAWGESNEAGLHRIATNKLFRIENHGSLHRCLSSNGVGVYGLPATHGSLELQDEIQGAQDFISNRTGRAPGWFRPAGLGADAMGLQAVASRYMRTAGCAVALDEGATASVDRMVRLGQGVKPGDIVLVHLNHPGKSVARGFEKVYQVWVQAGYTFSPLP